MSIAIAALWFAAATGSALPPPDEARTVAGPGAATPPSSATTVIAEHRYRLAARIRPLLVFWIGRDNVGGARIVWRQGEGGQAGFEMLIGSDPRRAPRGINRWGFIREEPGTAGMQVTGVMKQSDETSLDEAKSTIASESKDGYFFKAISALVTGAQSEATVTVTRSPRDFTYRDLPQLLDYIGVHPDRVRRRDTRLPPGTRPGFLSAVAELVRRTVADYQRSGRAPRGRDALDYVYFGNFYTVSRRSVALLDQATYDGRAYSRLLDTEFEVLNKKEGTKESFELVFGSEGALLGVPVFITYQPRWWFKAELVLDEREKMSD